MKVSHITFRKAQPLSYFFGNPCFVIICLFLLFLEMRAGLLKIILLVFTSFYMMFSSRVYKLFSVKIMRTVSIFLQNISKNLKTIDTINPT